MKLTNNFFIIMGFLSLFICIGSVLCCHTIINNSTLYEDEIT